MYEILVFSSFCGLGGRVVSSQIRELQKDSDFEQCPVPKERSDWSCFKKAT